MTTYKRIDGDYHIQTVNPWDHVYIDTSNTYITGNLQVSGNLTYIDVTELNITDPFIVLNTSNTATYASNAGVLTHKTASDYAGIRYNTNSSQWELSSSTSASGETGTWTTIATGGAIGGANTTIQFNDSGFFAGNTNFTFDYANSQVELNGSMIFNNQGSNPSAVTSSTVLYSKTPGSGDTGLYFVSSVANDELISKSKAIVYSIIF